MARRQAAAHWGTGAGWKTRAVADAGGHPKQWEMEELMFSQRIRRSFGRGEMLEDLLSLLREVT